MNTNQFLQFMNKVRVYDLTQRLSIHTPPWPSYMPLGIQYFKRIENPVQFKTAMLNAKARLESGEHWDAPTPAASDNVPALLAQLAALHQQGVLTDEEFQQKKAQLLTKI